jgi:hypothetical protein
MSIGSTRTWHVLERELRQPEAGLGRVVARLCPGSDDEDESTRAESLHGGAREARHGRRAEDRDSPGTSATRASPLPLRSRRLASPIRRRASSSSSREEECRRHGSRYRCEDAKPRSAPRTGRYSKLRDEVAGDSLDALDRAELEQRSLQIVDAVARRARGRGTRTIRSSCGELGGSATRSDLLKTTI